MLAYIVSTGLYSHKFNSFGVFNLLFWALAVANWVHNVHFVSLLGAGDFCRIQTATDKHLFSVGVRHIVITDKHLEASVFYPMDKDFSDGNYDATWFKDPERTITSMKNVFGPMFGIPYIPGFLLRAYTRIIVPMKLNGLLCKKLASGSQPISPVVFSHGLSGDKAMYTAIYHALAAHGHLVIAVNHQDESCFHTYDKSGKEIKFLKKPFYVAPFRQAQIKIRSDEILRTLDELKNMSH